MGFSSSSSSDHQQDYKNMIMDEKNSSCLSSHDELSSMDSGGEEEVTSSFTTSSTSSLSHSISPPSGHPTASDPLNNMSSLLQQLPIKRGLSKYCDGKSKSFTCLADVKSVEDLAKPEHPYNKRLKSSKSFLGPSVHDQNASSRVIKKSSRASSSSFNGAKTNANKPPTHPPPRSNSTTHFPNQPSPQTQPQPQNKTHFIN